MKKTRLGRGSKANHLAYLGDAEIGSGFNIGAGTITCNYDGEKKHTTVLEDGVFIGSDTQLVAPVTVRKAGLRRGRIDHHQGRPRRRPRPRPGPPGEHRGLGEETEEKAPLTPPGADRPVLP